MTSYGSSKAALIFATKTMATELGVMNIRVNALAPSITKTDMFDQMDEKARNKLIESSALKRPAEAVEVANVALFRPHSHTFSMWAASRNAFRDFLEIRGSVQKKSLHVDYILFVFSPRDRPGHNSHV